MRRTLLLILLTLCCAVEAWGQTGQQITAGPFSTSGLLYVCPVPSGGTPCPSPSSIFKDSGLTQPLSNPITIAAQVTITFFAAGGQYTLEMPASGYQLVIGGSGGSLPQVTTNPSCPTSGASLSFNTATNQLLQCNNGVLTTATGSWGTVLDVAAQGVVSAKEFADGTVTSASATVTSAGQAHFNCPGAVYPCTQSTTGCSATAANSSCDVGAKIFATNICSGTQCDFTFEPTAQTILPSTQITVGRIGTINSATSVTVDCNSPGTCASPNGQSTLTGTATVFYGNDSTAALNAAFATQAQATGCPTVLIPQGIYFFNKPIFATLPFTAATNTCYAPTATNHLTISQIGAFNGGGGPTIRGTGVLATILVPTPDFSNAGASPYCIGGAGENMTFSDFSVEGGGQSFFSSGQTAFCGTGLFGAVASQVRDVTLHGWGARFSGASVPGISNSSIGYLSMTRVEVYGFGGIACQFGGDSSTMSQSVCGMVAGSASGSALSVVAGGHLQSSNSAIILGNPANGPQIDVAGTWESTNDYWQGNSAINTAPSDNLKVESTGAVYLANTHVTSMGANDNGIEVVASGKLFIDGFHETGAATARALLVNGTMYDGGNNQFLGVIQGTGNIYGRDTVVGACTGVGTASSTLGLRISGTSTTGTGIASTCTSTTIDAGAVMQKAGTLEYLNVTATAAGVNASSGVVTVLKNGASSGITCTIGTGTSCQDITHTVAFVTGDLISIQFTTQAADTLAGVKAYTYTAN